MVYLTPNLKNKYSWDNGFESSTDVDSKIFRGKKIEELKEGRRWGIDGYLFLRFGIRSLIVAVLCFLPAFSNELVGTGSSFPSNILLTWITAFEAETKNSIIYLPIGSGLGIKQIDRPDIDFIFTEKPFSPEELENRKLVQFPILVGSVVVAGNLGTDFKEKLTLTPSLISQIFFGKIRKWNDPLIQKLNPEVLLPSLNIIVVRRNDSAGTTLLFSQYLVKNCPKDMKDIRCDLILSNGVGVPVQGSEGIARTVKKLEGAIGYMEYSFATEDDLTIFNLSTPEGIQQKAGPESFWSTYTYFSKSVSTPRPSLLLDSSERGNWPIMAVSYLVFKKELSLEKQKSLHYFVEWIFNQGKETAEKMGFFLVPASVQTNILNSF